jgi:hypothetical protein
MAQQLPILSVLVSSANCQKAKVQGQKFKNFLHKICSFSVRKKKFVQLRIKFRQQALVVIPLCSAPHTVLLRAAAPCASADVWGGA